MSWPSFVIGEPETFSRAMIISSVTCTSLWRTISNVTGSTATAVPALAAAGTLHPPEQAGPVAAALAADERARHLDQHVGEGLEARLALVRRGLGRRAAVRPRQAHLLELLHARRDH